MKSFFSLTALLAGLSLFTLSASAQAPADNDYLDEMVITASRVEMPARQLGASVSVLDEESIEARGATTLVDVLRTLPGVGVSNSGGLGQPTALRIRGEEGFRTLVRIDGLDIADPTAPQPLPRLEHVLSSGIARVEVLRGPQGLIYGADAGGVVNVSTRRAHEDFAAHLDVEQGRYGTQRLALGLGDSGERVDYFVSAADLESDGFNARSADLPPADNDGYDNQTLHGRVGYQLSDAWRLEAVWRNTDARTHFDGCFTAAFQPTDRCHEDVEQRSGRVAAAYSGETHRHQLAYQRTDIARQSFADALPAFGFDGWTERVDYLGAWQVSASNQLVYGLEHKTEASENPGEPERERDQVGYFAEWQSEPAPRLFLTAGARRDDNDDFGEHTSVRVTGAYLVPLADDHTLKFKGTYGTGFRAPSLFEVATNASPFASPPASLTELAEETSAGYDAGLEYLGPQARASVIFFSQTVDDRIVFDVDTFSGYLQEAGEAESQGVELSAEVALTGQFVVIANYTYNEAETVDGSPRLRRPEHLYNLAFAWQGLNDKLRIYTALRGARDAVDVGNEKLDDYRVVDLNLRYQVLDWLEVYGRVENLFDEDYQEVLGFNAPRQSAYGGARIRF